MNFCCVLRSKCSLFGGICLETLWPNCQTVRCQNPLTQLAVLLPVPIPTAGPPAPQDWCLPVGVPCWYFVASTAAVMRAASPSAPAATRRLQPQSWCRSISDCDWLSSSSLRRCRSGEAPAKKTVISSVTLTALQRLQTPVRTAPCSVGLGTASGKWSSGTPRCARATTWYVRHTASVNYMCARLTIRRWFPFRLLIAVLLLQSDGGAAVRLCVIRNGLSRRDMLWTKTGMRRRRRVASWQRLVFVWPFGSLQYSGCYMQHCSTVATRLVHTGWWCLPYHSFATRVAIQNVWFFRRNF